MDHIASPAALTFWLARGLWGEVHPKLCQASIEADEKARVVRLRFEYDGDATGLAQECCSCAATSVIADFPSSWELDEQHVARPVPSVLSPLRHVVYLRWEPDDVV